MSRKDNTENDNKLKISSSQKVGGMNHNQKKMNKNKQEWKNSKESHFCLRKVKTGMNFIIDGIKEEW